MEAELDAQVAKIERHAKERARMEYDLERRELQAKMETELSQLQSQLKLFQKVRTTRQQDPIKVEGLSVCSEVKV